MYTKLLSLLTIVTFSTLSANAADTASDNGKSYSNPWGPGNPQFNPKTGFASWVFDMWNPPNQTPSKPLFFIDTARGAWGINVQTDTDVQPATINGTSYNAAWISFTDISLPNLSKFPRLANLVNNLPIPQVQKCLTPGQEFRTTVLFTIPGPYYGGAYGTVPTPTEGVDFFAQSATVPSAYDSFGHQVLGIYLGPTAQGPAFTLMVHSTVSDENPAVIRQILPEASRALVPGTPIPVTIIFSQQGQGQWMLRFVTVLGTKSFTSAASSQNWGTTWNKGVTEGLYAVRYFTSQGGITPGGPLEWTDMSVQ
jgi:hypothetical protein